MITLENSGDTIHLKHTPEFVEMYVDGGSPCSSFSLYLTLNEACELLERLLNLLSNQRGIS